MLSLLRTKTVRDMNINKNDRFKDITDTALIYTYTGKKISPKGLEVENKYQFEQNSRYHSRPVNVWKRESYISELFKKID